jgi:AcrR family transcriptional regulator
MGAVHHNSSDCDTISDKNLSPVQAQVIAALAQGRTATDAARDVGIHRTTIHHWFRNEPAFKTSFQEAQREYVETLHDGLRDLAARAVETLRSLLDDPKTPPSVRLRTALAVLQRPRFPKQGWTLPEGARMTEAINNPSVSAGAPDTAPSVSAGAPDTAPSVSAGAPDTAPSVSAGEPSSAPIARSAPCPCGSGNKYKRCCGSAGKFTPPGNAQPSSKAA